jgi:putative transposase
MPRYRITDQHGLNYLTCTIVGWIDIFTRAEYRDIVIESLNYCREHKGLRIYAYVLMSNHLHLIAKADGRQGLSAILRDFKKFTANKILDIIEHGNESRKNWMLHMFSYYARLNTNNRKYQVWINDNHPIELFSPEVIWQKVEYIHNNPVRAKWVKSPEEYLYSSAQNYAFDNQGCLLEVNLLEPFLSNSGYVFMPNFD